MLLVVGGHSRDIGKTSVAAGLIEALRDCDWTALKITPHHAYELTEEHQPGPGDSARFLAAGARRSFWLRTGNLRDALPDVARIRALGPNTIIESNSILEYVEPDLYLVVLDFAREDFKPSAARFLPRADAVVVIDHGLTSPNWKDVPQCLWESKPRFTASPPIYTPPALTAFLRQRFFPAE